MLDLIYIFTDWLNSFIQSFPIPTMIVEKIVDNVPTQVVVNDYLLALYNNTNIIIYLLWTILLIIFIWFILGFVKTVYYFVMDITK